MNRRELIRSAVLGAGGAAVAGAQETHNRIHIKSIAPAPAASAAEPWAPSVLDAHQNETVIQLSELIIPTTDTPGAKAAKVNEWVDLYLQDLAEDKGHSFLQGLGWLDGYAIKKHDEPFVKLTEPQQVAILEELDGAESEELKPGAEFFDVHQAANSSGILHVEDRHRRAQQGRRSRYVRLHPRLARVNRCAMASVRVPPRAEKRRPSKPRSRAAVVCFKFELGGSRRDSLRRKAKGGDSSCACEAFQSCWSCLRRASRRLSREG